MRFRQARLNVFSTPIFVELDDAYLTKTERKFHSTVMSATYQNQIIARRKRLLEIEQERSLLLEQLLQDVEMLIRADQPSVTRQPGNEKIEPTGRLGVSRSWRSILNRLANFSTFNAGDVDIVVQRLRREEPNERKKIKSQTQGNIRSQLSLLTKKEIVKRRGGGTYYVPARTKKLLDL